ncbi:MAG: hypothetical protein U0641_03415 [Anaerolineae bacterium]
MLQPQPGVWQWDGAAWQPVSPGTVRAGPDGDTELRRCPGSVSARAYPPPTSASWRSTQTRVEW